MAFLPETPRQRIFLLILVVVLIFVGLDIYFGARYSAQRDTNFRAFRWDSGTLWALRSSYQGEAWGHQVHTNSAGFRGPEEYPIQSKHAYRIITFGDSRTYGFGVEDDQTFSQVLQTELRQQGTDAEVINAGVHGFSAWQCRVRLQQLLRYQPNAAVFAPGYNDRRYLIIRPPDSDQMIPWIARIRKMVDWLQISNTFFAFMYEVGKHKLTALTEHPPRLDEVKVRVDQEEFSEDLQDMVLFCRDHQIQPVFLRIYQDPGSFSVVEQAARTLRANDAQEAVEIIEDLLNTIPDRAVCLSRYVLGNAYRKLGEEAKAVETFSAHQPIGSLFGESILRSEEEYMAAFQRAADSFQVPMVDGREAMVGQSDPLMREDDFRQFFIDECHFNAEGHHRMGQALADRFMKIIPSTRGTQTVHSS